MPDLLFVNAAEVVTCAGPARGRRGAEMRDAGIRRDVAVAVQRGRIAAVGPRAELETRYAAAEHVDCAGGVLTPGFVDSHTHAIFGRARYEEQELRAGGLDYLEIARRGGGIHASVRDLRTRSEDDLVALARPRLLRLASHGTTTVEVKTGYGLTIEDELKSLRAIQRQPPALLLVDIAMPVMRGDELLQRLRTDGFPTLPVVVMTADGSYVERAKD